MCKTVFAVPRRPSRLFSTSQAQTGTECNEWVQGGKKGGKREGL